MRRGVAVLGLGCLVLVVPTCGGNVAVEGASTGGPASTSGACSGVSTQPLCGGVVCGPGDTISNGCQTTATCNGKPVEVDCVGNPPGPDTECICRFDGTALTCNESSTSPTFCLPTGCCAMWFGG